MRVKWILGVLCFILASGNCINIDVKSKADSEDSNTNIELSSEFLLDYNDFVKQANMGNKTYHGQEKAANCVTDLLIMQGFLPFTLLNVSQVEDKNISQPCLDDIFKTVTVGLLNQKIWALQILDSMDLFPGSGFLLDGNFIHYPGNLQECIAVSDDPDAVKSAHFTLTLTSEDPKYKLCPVGLGWPRIGKCFPASCTNLDVEKISDDYLSSKLKVPHKTTVLNKNFVNDESEGMTTGQIVMLIITIVIATIVAISTIIDVIENQLEIILVQTKVMALIQGFSLYTNTSKLFNTETDPSNTNLMTCLNGLRAISVFWVVTGHTFFEMCGTGLLVGNGYMVKNFPIYSKDDGPTDKLYMTPFWNGMFMVDTFFLMGALLIAFHTLKEMDKIKDKPIGHWIMFWFAFYVHRYIRLSAIYAIVIGLNATFLETLATGPNSHLILHQADQCKEGWYYNLLYINNFVSDIQGLENARTYNCMGWTWYLANDMQFFVITPFLLYILWKKPYVGVVVMNLLLIAFTATPFAITWSDREEFFHGKQDDFYVKPWDRFQPYLIGLMLGFGLHHMRNKKTVDFSIVFNMVMWLVSGVLSSSVVYGIHEYSLIKDPKITMPPFEPPRAVRAFYNGLSKLAWSFAICWVIFTCVKGRGGVINSFLSWGLWAPLAKLSYCIYLIQYTVIYWFNSQIPTSQMYTNTLYMYTAFGNLAVCIGLAIVLYLMFEVPLAHAEKIMFGLLGIGRMPRATRRNVDEKKPAKA